jgi:hypothetical protein
MKRIIFLAFLLVMSMAQGAPSISGMDFLKVKNGKTAEATFFYENNWKVYRGIALKRGFIRSYRLLKTEPESGSDFDLILVTEYADTEQLKLSEERFNAIIKEINPGPAKLLNGVVPSDFRQIIFSKKAETMMESRARQSTKPEHFETAMED